MKRIICVAFLATLGAIAVALPTSASSSEALRAEFRDSSPCPGAVDLCGKGIVQDFGRVTTTLTFTSLSPGPGANCVSGTADRMVTLDRDGSTLRLAVAGTICDQKIAGTFAIASATGVFAGASGGGTLSGVVVPDGDAVAYRGTITLP